MACDHRLIQKQWMLGQVGYEDSCPECDNKRIAELELLVESYEMSMTKVIYEAYKRFKENER